MDIPTQKALALSGPISLILTVSALHMMGFIPLPPATMGAEQIAALYREHSAALCRGLIVFMISAGVFLGFVAELSIQIKRIEGERRTFTYLQLVAGTASITPLIIAPLAWSVAAFRPQHSPEFIQAFNDLGSITMIWATPAAAVQVLAVGLATLCDKSPQPIFPRWSAYASFLCAIGLQCGLLAVLSQTGPLAWDGIVSGGIESMVFIPWTLLMCVLLLRAIGRQQNQETESAAVAKHPQGIPAR